MIGVSAYPASSLVQRTVERLAAAGPQSSPAVCKAIFGLANVPPAVAERLAVAVLASDPRVRRLADGRWAVVAEASGSPLLDDCAFAVVDVETTGMRAGQSDRITEIAIVVVHGSRRELVFESLVNPERPIPGYIAGVTGISDAMVRDAPTFGDIAEQVEAALAGRVFVAHNARFDWAFVSAEMRRARDLAFDGPRLCTVRLARRLLAGVQSCGLDNLTRYFGFENRARHRAAGDALVTAELLARLLAMAREAGARTLQELAAIESRRISRPRKKRKSALPTEPRMDSAGEGT